MGKHAKRSPRHEWMTSLKASPARSDQLEQIRRLSAEVGAPFPISGHITAWMAYEEIQALTSRRRNGLFGQAATLNRSLDELRLPL